MVAPLQPACLVYRALAKANEMGGRIEPRGMTPEPADVVAYDTREPETDRRTADPDGNATQERYWTTAYFHHPNELRNEVAGAGFAVRERLAV